MYLLLQGLLFPKMRRKKYKRKKKQAPKRLYCFIEKPGSLLRRFKVRPKISEAFGNTPKEESLICPKCNLIIMSNKKWNLKRHLKLHNDHQIIYECNSCGQKYSTLYNFEKHIPRRHKNEDTTNISYIPRVDTSRSKIFLLILCSQLKFWYLKTVLMDSKLIFLVRPTYPSQENNC